MDKSKHVSEETSGAESNEQNDDKTNDLGHTSSGIHQLIPQIIHVPETKTENNEAKKVDAESHAHIEESQLDWHLTCRHWSIRYRPIAINDTCMHVNESDLTARLVTDDYIVSP